jgi:hypothetical protein
MTPAASIRSPAQLTLLQIQATVKRTSQIQNDGPSGLTAEITSQQIEQIEKLQAQTAELQLVQKVALNAIEKEYQAKIETLDAHIQAEQEELRRAKEQLSQEEAQGREALRREDEHFERVIKPEIQMAKTLNLNYAEQIAQIIQKQTEAEVTRVRANIRRAYDNFPKTGSAPGVFRSYNLLGDVTGSSFVWDAHFDLDLDSSHHPKWEEGFNNFNRYTAEHPTSSHVRRLPGNCTTLMVASQPMAFVRFVKSMPAVYTFIASTSTAILSSYRTAAVVSLPHNECSQTRTKAQISGNNVVDVIGLQFPKEKGDFYQLPGRGSIQVVAQPIATKGSPTNLLQVSVDETKKELEKRLHQKREEIRTLSIVRNFHEIQIASENITSPSYDQLLFRVRDQQLLQKEIEDSFDQIRVKYDSIFSEKKNCLELLTKELLSVEKRRAEEWNRTQSEVIGKRQSYSVSSQLELDGSIREGKAKIISAYRNRKFLFERFSALDNLKEVVPVEWISPNYFIELSASFSPSNHFPSGYYFNYLGEGRGRLNDALNRPHAIIDPCIREIKRVEEDKSGESRWETLSPPLQTAHGLPSYTCAYDFCYEMARAVNWHSEEASLGLELLMCLMVRWKNIANGNDPKKSFRKYFG